MQMKMTYVSVSITLETNTWLDKLVCHFVMCFRDVNKSYAI